ncbi:element excision factor XisI family protein [Trichormus sp. NMC-1]|uniref:element excision factor XisI family protein n=1 Tax=Trichormus sp. NMC-1 TaxID=1853259 RepID=UPI0009F5F41F|nr:element excision factor XisI family protein [Trichormus sp. NMC-1]
MTKLEDYRQYIQQILTKYPSYKPAYREIKVETIFHTQRDHDQIVHIISSPANC